MGFQRASDIAKKSTPARQTTTKSGMRNSSSSETREKTSNSKIAECPDCRGGKGNRTCARCGGTGLVCRHCKGTGFVYRLNQEGRPSASECICGKVKLRRANALRPLLEQYSSLQGELLEKSFFNFKGREGSPGLPQAIAAAQKFAKQPKRWLVLVGKPGVGKTHLAAAIANELIARHQLVMFLNIPKLLVFLREGFNVHRGQSPDFNTRLNTIKDSPILILDDWGAHSDTPWADEQLYIILNHRMELRLPTVVTSNRALDELESRISSRLMNRHLSTWVHIEATDYRIEA